MVLVPHLWNEKHPILGYNKMLEELILQLRGTPWPRSGTVTRARWCGGEETVLNKT